MAYTTINDPSAHFQTALYNGSSSSVTVTNDGNSNLKPDWLWIKRRSGSGSDHNVFDTVRGLTERLFPNLGSASDTTNPNGITSLTDGFTTGTSYGNVNGNGETFVGWQWAAGGATPTKTYRVVVVSDSGNKYRFRNSTNTATFAQSAVTLELQSGGTYTFDQSDSTVASHPMKFSTTSNGTHGGGTSYNTGVTYKLDGSTVTESAYVSGFASATTRQIILNVQNTTTLYYYCHYHSGMGGQVDQNATFGQTNFDGSILSRSSENATSGFSIVRHTGTGSAGTVGHGLGGVPDWIVTKRRTQADDWAVYQTNVGNEYYLEWNSTNARQSASSVWGDTTPTALSFTVGGANDKNNASSATYVSYCFKSVKGYSKIGGYIGNGSQDGTFVYTGFKPAWIMAKRYDASKNWYVADSKRSPVNINKAFLVPNTSDAEDTAGSITDSYFDILSNGFKLRQDFSHLNASGAAHMYMAFAEHPLVASNNVVATAR
jgi:hypothetical protein